MLLLDLKDPCQAFARGRYNILEPREIYELTGQVPNVVFPERRHREARGQRRLCRADSDVLIYYGAADTVVGLAIASVAKLVTAARTE